jgi:hypothetical protein
MFTFPAPVSRIAIAARVAEWRRRARSRHELTMFGDHEFGEPAVRQSRSKGRSRQVVLAALSVAGRKPRHRRGVANAIPFARTRFPLIPAQAGIQRVYRIGNKLQLWVPAFAGTSG